MVSPKIYTGETPMQELKGNLGDELQKMGEAAALEIGCPVENLKWRVNNLGVIEWQEMDDDEVVEMKQREFQAKQIRDIKKSRGIDE